MDQLCAKSSMSSPFGGPGRVQVYARTRPTPDFPHDMIQLESDKKVNFAPMGLMYLTELS